MQNFGIYIHIPFCQKKCKYCDFISFDKCDEKIKEKYVNALIKEIENYCRGRVPLLPSNNNPQKITTIYIGGGTPSILSAEQIQKILQKIKEKFILDENAEITIEINPGTVDFTKLENYKKIGINRLSIGLQSTDDRILKLLGRVHNYDDFLKTYDNAKKIGFKNINVDLMLGLPTQDLFILEESLQNVINLNPEHISLYSLILEEGTELEKLVLNNQLEMISEDLERKMYWKTKDILEKNGYKHYEISNFSKPGFESKHNVSCWEQEEYIGFGLSAHSYINKKRFSNIENLQEYISNIENQEFEKNVILQENDQTFEIQAKEYMMLGLRKIDGVSISKFEQKFQINPLFYFRFEISKLEEERLIEVDLDHILLTKKGLDFANRVFQKFV